MRARLPISVSILALLTVPLAAQEQPRAAFEEKVVVTEVLLDVLVTDSRGNVILGLDQKDFVVEEAGEPVEITGATFYSNRRLVDSGEVAARLGIETAQVPVDRFFILFFHDARRFDPSYMSSQTDAVRRARQWAYEELLPNDWVAVVSYDARLRIHQDFTTDNELIEAALKEVAKGKDPGDLWASRVAEHKGPSLAKNLPSGKELGKSTRRIYSALDVLAEAAGHIIGRKNLLLFSIGFGETGDFGGWRPDPRYFPPTVEKLNDNNVAVYSISLIENISEENPGVAEMNNGLSLLSDETGGRYYFNFVNFADPLRNVVEDNNGYYLLSYKSEHPAGTSGYRKVDVKTRNPDFVVRARQGYLYGG